VKLLQGLYDIQREHDIDWKSTILLAHRNVNYDRVTKWVQNFNKPNHNSVNRQPGSASQSIYDSDETRDITFALDQLGEYQVAQLKEEIGRIRWSKCRTYVGDEFTATVLEHGILRPRPRGRIPIKNLKGI
jgi:hypothetical protein